MITKINEFKNISEKKKKAKKKLSDADKEFISNKIKTLMDEGRPHDQAIAMAYSYLERSKKKKNESFIGEAVEVKSKIVDVKKLEQYATALLVICGGEYGDTYFNPETNSVFICLGDANPFDIEYLEDFVLDYIKKDYSVRDQINIEIDMECGPNSGTPGWLEWDGKKWKEINY